MRLEDTDVLTYSNTCISVNGLPFVVEYPDEPICSVEDNELVTRFRNFENRWLPSEIRGYYA